MYPLFNLSFLCICMFFWCIVCNWCYTWSLKKDWLAILFNQSFGRLIMFIIFLWCGLKELIFLPNHLCKPLLVSQMFWLVHVVVQSTSHILHILLIILLGMFLLSSSFSSSFLGASTTLFVIHCFVFIFDFHAPFHGSSPFACWWLPLYEGS